MPLSWGWQQGCSVLFCLACCCSCKLPPPRASLRPGKGRLLPTSLPSQGWGLLLGAGSWGFLRLPLGKSANRPLQKAGGLWLFFFFLFFPYSFCKQKLSSQAMGKGWDAETWRRGSVWLQGTRWGQSSPHSPLHHPIPFFRLLPTNSVFFFLFKCLPTETQSGLVPCIPADALHVHPFPSASCCAPGCARGCWMTVDIHITGCWMAVDIQILG